MEDCVQLKFEIGIYMTLLLQQGMYNICAQPGFFSLGFSRFVLYLRRIWSMITLAPRRVLFADHLWPDMWS